MKDPVSRSLDALATGLRPYVAVRVEAVLRNPDLAADVDAWDAQGLLLFIWERWNDLFRSELSFVERCLVSELRDFRNRWAHQDQLCEKDIYRILDGIERLLHAVNSPEQHEVADLRRESLNRLWSEEIGGSPRSRMVRALWPYLQCAASAIAIDTALVTFISSPWCWILSVLVFVAMMRISWLQSLREANQSPGPRECSHCGRIIYSVDCPYCNRAAYERNEGSKDEKLTVQPQTGPWTAFRLPQESRPASHDQTRASAKNASQENL